MRTPKATLLPRADSRTRTPSGEMKSHVLTPRADGLHIVPQTTHEDGSVCLASCYLFGGNTVTYGYVSAEFFAAMTPETPLTAIYDAVLRRETSHQEHEKARLGKRYKCQVSDAVVRACVALGRNTLDGSPLNVKALPKDRWGGRVSALLDELPAHLDPRPNATYPFKVGLLEVNAEGQSPRKASLELRGNLSSVKADLPPSLCETLGVVRGQLHFAAPVVIRLNDGTK